MTIDIARQQERLVEHALKYYTAGDKSRWCAALMCAEVCGNYSKGATIGLAKAMNKSVDTVEGMAHAYNLYADLRAIRPVYVNRARKTPGIYMSHFRTLYDIQKRYNLDIEQVMDLLEDIVQAAQTPDKISNRDLEKHATDRYGLVRGWDYYALRAFKDLVLTLGCPDLPSELRGKLLESYQALEKLDK